jgi:hypothetical protein
VAPLWYRCGSPRLRNIFCIDAHVASGVCASGSTAHASVIRTANPEKENGKMAIKVKFEIYAVHERKSNKTGAPYAVADVGVPFDGETIRGELFVPVGTKQGVYEAALQCFKRDGNVSFGLSREFVAAGSAAVARA